MLWDVKSSKIKGKEHIIIMTIIITSDYIEMNISPFLCLLAMALSLVRDGTSIHLETCECHEIRELVNASVQHAVGSLEDRLSVMIDTAISNISMNLNMIFEKVESSQQQIDTPELNPGSPAASCAAIYTYNPSAPSGLYTIGTLGYSSTQYCDMTLSCLGITGGWMRVIDLNMTDISQQCPSGLMERNDSPNIRTCVRNEASAGCSSVELSTANIQYTRVCGRITGYQYESLDGFNNNDINSAYVDGVSLTYGSPRQHIRSFAATANCNCFNAPEIVGNDFLCDSGSHGIHYTSGILFTSPLWDGAGCSTTSPYFVKTLAQSTTDDIEMRLCRDELSSNEDVAIEVVELYVQ